MNLARMHEAIAAAFPDRDCLVFRDRRYTYSQITDRTQRLGAVMRAHGLGCHHERDQLNGWESGQDHVALFLYNGNEYLEAMLGAYKARCVPFNVNYRYVEDELLYLFDNADAKAVIYHARFAPTLDKIRSQLSTVKLWIQVADESDNPLLEGAVDYETIIANTQPEPMDTAANDDDLYMVYTGGTTGMPKGVLWRQKDIFYSAIARAEQPFDLDDYVQELKIKLQKRPAPIGMPIPPFMHASAQWVAFGLWTMAGTVVVQSNPEQFDAQDIWSTVQREGVGSMNIIGDAFAAPLLDELERANEAGEPYDLSSMRLISSGGAILTPERKGKFQQWMPQANILDILGSSESGTQASQLTKTGDKAKTGDFAPKGGSVLLDESLSHLLPQDSEEKGWVARSGFMPLGYYKDESKTAKTFPTIAGIRYSVPGDKGAYDGTGNIKFFGRDSVCINTGGEKVFAEEVELALKKHPQVYDAIVCPTPSDRWGQQITAVIQFRESQGVDDTVLNIFVKEHLAPYKVPKVFLSVDKIQRAPNGKPDYRWARETALTMLEQSQPVSA